MSYALPADMITRFGQMEMLRLTSPEDQPLDVIDPGRLQTALDDASAVIDSYLRRRYLTPVNPAPQELVRACCILARYDLAHGDGRAPSDQMTSARKSVEAWLESVRDGKTLLADATPAGEQSSAQVAVRQGASYGGLGAVPQDGCVPYDTGAGDPGAGYPLPPFGSYP